MNAPIEILDYNYSDNIQIEPGYYICLTIEQPKHISWQVLYNKNNKWYYENDCMDADDLRSRFGVYVMRYGKLPEVQLD